MIILFCIIIVFLSVADYFTTKKILSQGGVELNPVMKWCIERKLFAIGKAGLTIIIVAGLLYIRKSPWSLISSLIISVGYGCVVWHNWRQIR